MKNINPSKRTIAQNIRSMNMDPFRYYQTRTLQIPPFHGGKEANSSSPRLAIIDFLQDILRYKILQ